MKINRHSAFYTLHKYPAKYQFYNHFSTSLLFNGTSSLLHRHIILAVETFNKTNFEQIQQINFNPSSLVHSGNYIDTKITLYFYFHTSLW